MTPAGEDVSQAHRAADWAGLYPEERRQPTLHSAGHPRVLLERPRLHAEPLQGGLVARLHGTLGFTTLGTGACECMAAEWSK